MCMNWTSRSQKRAFRPFGEERKVARDSYNRKRYKNNKRTVFLSYFFNKLINSTTHLFPHVFQCIRYNDAKLSFSWEAVKVRVCSSEDVSLRRCVWVKQKQASIGSR